MTPGHLLNRDPQPLPDTRMDGVVFSLLRTNGSFSLCLPSTPTVNFYFVRRGRVLFEADGALPVRAELTEHACVGLSARIPHTLKSVEPCTEQALRNEPLGTPDQGDRIEIIVSSVPEETVLYVRAFQDIPIIFPDTAQTTMRSIRRAVDWVEEESTHGQGDSISHAITRRLAEIIHFEMVRFNMQRQPEYALSLRAAHADKRILKALTTMYQRPEHPWTLQTLADEACMSRTAFSERYREVVGTTPLLSLQRLRLKRAADQLLNGTMLPIEQVATTWGYSSAAVFIRAFTREFGVTPGRWRIEGQRHDGNRGNRSNRGNRRSGSRAQAIPRP